MSNKEINKYLIRKRIKKTEKGYERCKEYKSFTSRGVGPKTWAGEV